MDLIQERTIREVFRKLEGVPGDCAEIGVHEGESAELICGLAFPDSVYLFDTFTGMPAEMVDETRDYHRAGDFGGTNVATKTLDRIRRYGDQVKLAAGVFPESAKGLSPRLKFVHIDVDLYRSTKAAIEWCWPLLVPGGYVVNDDYGCGSCRGAKEAVDEFMANRSDAVMTTNNRLAIIQKREANYA